MPNRNITLFIVALVMSVSLAGCGIKTPGQNSPDGLLGAMGSSVSNVDSIDWATYTSTQLGFQIKLLPEWSEVKKKLGSDQGASAGRWSNIIGEAGTVSSEGPSQFMVLVKRSEKSLSSLNEDMGWVADEGAGVQDCAGLSCIRQVITGRGGKDGIEEFDRTYNLAERVIIDGGDGIFYLMEFGAYGVADRDTVERYAAEFDQVIDSFARVEIDERRVFSSPELGFEMDLTPVWPELQVKTGPVEPPNGSIGELTDALGEARNVTDHWFAPEWLNVRIIAKRSNANLEEFNAGIGNALGENPAVQKCAGLPCYRLRESSKSFAGGGVGYPEIVLIDGDGIFYYIETASVRDLDSDTTERYVAGIDESVDSFRRIDVQE